MSRIHVRVVVLSAIIVTTLAAIVLHSHLHTSAAWRDWQSKYGLHIPQLDFASEAAPEEVPYHLPYTPDVSAEIDIDQTPNFTASNSTLGFQAILALSQGTKWRVDGLHAAAKVSGITVTIPPQPKWSKPFVKAFELFGPVSSHGAAMAWLGHLDLLKFVIQNGWGSALILEDDMDWDIGIRNQTALIADAVLKLNKTSPLPYAPYGLDWDIMWLGHCSDPPPANENGQLIFFKDPLAAPLALYKGLNPHIRDVVKQGQRVVHYSVNPVCTFAYAVSAAGARKLLAHASLGRGGAFDLMLMHACQDKVVDCITVNPEVFHPYETAEEGSSEVRAGDADQSINSDAGREKGWTSNILHSARCLALFNETCLR